MEARAGDTGPRAGLERRGRGAACRGHRSTRQRNQPNQPHNHNHRHSHWSSAPGTPDRARRGRWTSGSRGAPGTPDRAKQRTHPYPRVPGKPGHATPHQHPNDTKARRGHRTAQNTTVHTHPCRGHRTTAQPITTSTSWSANRPNITATTVEIAISACGPCARHNAIPPSCRRSTSSEQALDTASAATTAVHEP